MHLILKLLSKRAMDGDYLCILDSFGVFVVCIVQGVPVRGTVTWYSRYLVVEVPKENHLIQL